MCCPPNLDFPPEVRQCRNAAGFQLTFTIIGGFISILGFFIYSWIGTIASIVGIVGASMVLCCMPFRVGPGSGARFAQASRMTTVALGLHVACIITVGAVSAYIANTYIDAEGILWPTWPVILSQLLIAFSEFAFILACRKSEAAMERAGPPPIANAQPITDAVSVQAAPQMPAYGMPPQQGTMIPPQSQQQVPVVVPHALAVPMATATAVPMGAAAAPVPTAAAVPMPVSSSGGAGSSSDAGGSWWSSK